MLPKHLEQFSTPIRVLDHGYVMLVDVMGDDDAIVQAARVSYALGTTRTKDDRGLLRYLMRSKHTSPFEQARIKLEVKLPIFVERQWVRHRMASLNEMSARYSILPNEFYIPEPSSVQAQSTTNKQGREHELPDDTVATYIQDLRQTCADAYASYECALDSGVTRELARCLLPVNVYTAKVWTMDLHNLLHFLALRMDPHAQQEIRQYAKTIAQIVKVWVPNAWEAFEDYTLKSVQLSAMELKGLASVLKPHDPDLIVSASGLQGREASEFRDKLKKILEA